MFALIVVLLILSVLLFPFAKRVFERYRFLRRLKGICHLKRYTVKTIKPFAAYFCNYSDPCAVTVDTGKCLYAVNFWSEYYANSNLIFTKGGKVIRRKKVSDIFSFSGKRTHKVSEKSLINIKNRSPIVASARSVETLFIVFFEKTSLFYLENGQLKAIDFGEKIYDMTFMSGEMALNLFENRGVTANKV